MPGALDRIGNMGVRTHQASQKSIAAFAGNVSGAADPNRTVQDVKVTTNVLGGKALGIRVSEPERVVNTFLNDTRRQTEFDVGYYEILASSLGELQTSVGAPGDDKSLLNLVTNFKVAWEQLSHSASDPMKSQHLLTATQGLSNQLNRLSSDVQQRRSDASLSILRSLNNVTDLLEDLDALNVQMRSLTARNQSAPDIEDKQDHILRQLSRYMTIDYKKQPLGDIYVSTSSGLSLLDIRVHDLSYTVGASLTHADTYPGTIPGILLDGVDITSQITGGRIAAHIHMRDTYCVKRQQALDEWTYHFMQDINTQHNLGVSGASANSLTSQKTGLAGGTAFAGTGSIRVAVLDNATGKMISAVDVNLATCATIGALQAAVTANPNIASSIDGSGHITFNAVNGNYGIAIIHLAGPPAVAEGGSGVGFNSFFGFLDVFTASNYTPDGHASNPAPVGIAKNIGVASYLTSNSQLFTTGYLTTAGILATDTTTQVCSKGSSQSAMAMHQLLNTQRTFNTAGDIEGGQYSYQEYLTALHKRIQLDIEAADSKLNSAYDLMNFAQEQVDKVSGIDIRTEMLKIKRQLAQAHAGAELMRTYQELISILFTILRGK